MKLKILLIFCLSYGWCYSQEKEKRNPRDLPLETSRMFTGSGNCQNCHFAKDNILFVNGVDVAPPSHWRSTMMANAAKDPLWRAKVSVEVIEFPHLKKEIETKCTTCHAPMGYTEAILYAKKKKKDPKKEKPGYSIAQLEQSKLAQDGVSCTACHQIQDENLGEKASFSGKYVIKKKAKTIFGPYPDPYGWPMTDNTRFKPKYSEHIGKSELCATCHTLFTPYVDDAGKIVGEFPEQTPYLEWKNSSFPENKIQCQTCHMPQILTPLVIADMLPADNQIKRSPFWQHFFVGGNTFMLKLLKHNIDELGITAEESHFDATISRTQYQLENLSLKLSASHTIKDQKLNLQVSLQNLAGHKLPSGIPIRRMWLYIKVTQPNQEKPIFESGNWNQEGEIIHLDPDFEPHYDLITQENQVQIYEGVMQDVNKKVTYTLLRAADYLKDNRIPPKGFQTNHIDYKNTKIAGKAKEDPNYNKEGNKEGTGKDIVTYQIPYQEDKAYSIEVKVCYQSVTPRFIQHLFQFSTPEVEKFKKMYHREDKTPNIIKSLSLKIPAKEK